MARAEPASSIEKAIDLLFHLSAQSAPQGVTALAQSLGVPKSSAHRMLASLSRRGLVERDERGRYREGFGLLALGLGVLEREPLVEAARPVLSAEASAVGETFFLVAARSGRLVVLDKVEGSGFLRAAPRLGAEIPVHQTAVGKLYLALAPEQVGATAEHVPASASGATLADAVSLAGRRGFAVNRDEWIAGLSVVAAPVRRGERMLGALAVAAASPRFDQLGASALASKVVAAADAVASRLAGTPTGREEER